MKYLLFSALAVLLISCHFKSETYKLPKIPQSITQPSQRAEYLADHYWDQYDLSDTDSIPGQGIENAWKNYCYVLNKIPQQKGKSLLTAFFGQKDIPLKNKLYFTELAERYLYYQDSQIHNEELYLSALETIIADTSFPADNKLHYQYQLALLKRNRVGTKALDFKYTGRSGSIENLYKIKSEYILLFFNNPGCEECHLLTKQLMQSPIIKKQTTEGRLMILAIHPDNDVNEWRKHLHDFPQQWIVGYDPKQEILKHETYDLSFIPTLYLLDSNKTVILKNASLSQISQWLSAHQDN